VNGDLARAICVLAESLVSGKRVVVVGDSSLALHALLGEMGARLVHVYDPDAHRAMAQPPPEARGTVLRGLPDGDFDVRDGAFDLAIVPDLTIAHDAAALLARLRRVVGADGAVLCAANNRDGGDDGTLGYYELYDLVALQFANVRMIAVMPFFGMTLAELGQDEVDSAVRVDAQLVPADRAPPSAFVALASQGDVALDAYTVIETGEAPSVIAAPHVPNAALTTELAQARIRADALAARVEELTHATTARVRAEEEARRALDALDVQHEHAARLERELDALRNRPAPPPPPPAHDAELAEELARAQIRAAALEEGVELAEKTIVVQRERIAELESELARTEEALAAKATEPEHLPENETILLEEKLRERGEHVSELEAEIARREKLVRELVARLAANGAHGDVDPALPAKLDELAHLAAHQRLELEARAWRIAELERRQREAPKNDS
jgi:SAM-dependent methyltransferase